MQDVQPLYKWIVDSVVAKARSSFLQEGIDEAVLEELKARWEQRLHESAVFDAAQGTVESKDAGTSEAAAEGEAQKRPAGEDAEGAGAAKQVKDADGAAQAAPSEAQAAPPDAAATSAQGEAPAAPAAAAAEAAPAGATEGEATDAAAAASDDDDGLVDEEADDIPNLVLAQYDKVVRNRNKWKCTLKQGIVHIDGREYVFGKASGDFVF